MFYDDHPPPHFHVSNAGNEASVSIDPVRVIRGSLNRRVASLIIEWATIYRDELLENWRRARALEPLVRIPPLAGGRGVREELEVEMERAVAVRVVRPYVIEVTFEDGERRRIDVEPLLYGRVFRPLRDPDFFARVRVDPVFGSVEWPNGADLAPESLRAGEPVAAE